jgi:hydroxymethylpyrimidine/phosphomethylpyrimidine kinase
VFATSVVTAVTAQNTVEVVDSFELPISVIEAQLNAVLDDFDISAAKTGMLASSDIVRTIASILRSRALETLVVDPVMVSQSGCKLLKDDAIDALRNDLIPLALVVTPNIHEAELLAGMSIESDDDVRKAARQIHELGCRSVLIKGGHADFNRATDVLLDGRRFSRFEGTFVDTKNLHGTGCTFSAAITARLSLGEPLIEAVSHAKTYISKAIESSLDIGRGHGPTNHFYFIGPDSHR